MTTEITGDHYDMTIKVSGLTPSSPITILGNRVLVELEGVNEETKQGEIIIPDEVREKRRTGYATIVALGDEVKSKAIKTAFRNEQKIFIGNYIGVPMNYNGKSYRILLVPDIFAVVE